MMNTRRIPMMPRCPKTPMAVLVAGMISLLALSTRAAESPGLTPQQAWDRLKDGNELFATEQSEEMDLGAIRRRELVAGQHPFAAVLCCADSRVPPEHVFNQGLGDLFVVRVAGNVSEPFMLGSIDYAVEHLHVPLIVVLGHEKCGAVTAALGKDKPEGNLGKLIGQIHVGKHLPADKDAALAHAVESNARQQAKLLMERSEIVREHVKQQKLLVVTGIYDLATGKVRWLKAK
jgi:carbonic anhydrase